MGLILQESCIANLGQIGSLLAWVIRQCVCKLGRAAKILRGLIKLGEGAKSMENICDDNYFTYMVGWR